jgi:uncharacterized protein YndB with AHSA1/START domain
MDMADNKELTITRTFNAPRDMVWRAWTDPKIVAQWWGPRGVTNPTCEWDARPNGKINIVMLAGKELGDFAGQEWPMSGTFEEVTPKDRMVYVSGALEDRKGSETLVETRTTVTFNDIGEKTKLTIQISIIRISDSPKAQFAVQGMEQGWNQQIDKLGKMLEKK